MANNPVDNPLGESPKIEDVTAAKGPVQEPQQLPEEAAGRQFEPLMEETSEAQATEAPSPMELAQQGGGGKAAAEVTPESLHEGLGKLDQNVETFKGEMTPDRFKSLSQTQKTLLNTKLGQFGQGVKGLSQRLDVPYDVPKQSGLMENAKTLLNWLTQGQNQLQSVGDKLAATPSGQISVVQMMRAQAQMLAADRAINFATAVVSKGTSFITSLMQTQL